VTDPGEIVRAGYDAIAERYNEWAATFETPEPQWVEDLLSRLEDGSDVLDLGCGGGRAAARRIAALHHYMGVDISETQLRRARASVPEGRFVRADVTELELEDSSFDAVVSLFMFGHIPRAGQAPLVAAIHRWLRPRGWLLMTMGIGDSADVIEEDWLGAPMFFASFDEETNRRLLAEAGFELVRDRVITHDEPGHGSVSFMWVLASRE
jgi:SAM-dependent methyltransferase